MRFATVLLIIGLSLALSGCWFGKKTTVVPPPPAAQPKQVPPVKPPELILGKLVPYFVIGLCDFAVAVLPGRSRDKRCTCN